MVGAVFVAGALVESREWCIGGGPVPLSPRSKAATDIFQSVIRDRRFAE